MSRYIPVSDSLTYIRVSTSMQVEGYSLEAQRERLNKFADFQDIDDKGGGLKKPEIALFSGVRGFRREAEKTAKSKIIRSPS